MRHLGSIRTWVGTAGVALAAGVLFLGVASAGPPSPFRDVPRSHWAYQAVISTTRQGFFDGFDGYKTPGVFSGKPAGETLSKTVAQASLPAAFGTGLRPQLQDPLAEAFAREIERVTRLRRIARTLELPPPPAAKKKTPPPATKPKTGS